MGKNKQMKKNEVKALSITHPNSRKAAKLAKQTIKEAARRKVKTDAAIRRNMFGEKLIWFRDNLAPGDVYTSDMALELLEKYTRRFDEELEQIQLKHSIGQRKNRQHASREDIIRLTITDDKQQLETCGIEIVDILNPKQLGLLRKWDGNLNFIQNFKIVRYSRNYLKNYKAPVNPQQKSDKLKVDEQKEGKLESESVQLEQQNQQEMET